MTINTSSDNILSVTALNRLARRQLESGIPLSWVAGEISNLTYAASGHVYFTLKDEGAQVRCAMWRSRAQLMTWRLSNGQKVEVRALVTLYEPRGDYQLNVETVRRAGQGNLFEQFLQLKARLEAEGLFAPARKRPLPTHPRCIGLITSLQAAALRDVLSTLARRAPQVRVVVFPTPVQGEGAGQQIADALIRAGSSGLCDTLILCRGGGSIEDLWAFNEEVVARAIIASPVPVVSGVGHETDFTIADFAADLRAPTPTAAAELCSPDRQQLQHRLDGLSQQLSYRTTRLLADRGQQLDWLARRLIHPAERLQRQAAELDQKQKQLQQAVERQMERHHQRLILLRQRLSTRLPQPGAQQSVLQSLKARLKQAALRQQEGNQLRLRQLEASVRQLNPHAVLSRGYTLARTADGKAIRDARQLAPGTAIQLSFKHGKARATVDEVVTNLEAD